MHDRLAAPLLAGVVAEMLAYNELRLGSPDDTFTFLANIASWSRRGPTERVIWNLVNERHNPPTIPLTGLRLLNITNGCSKQTLVQ